MTQADSIQILQEEFVTTQAVTTPEMTTQPQSVPKSRTDSGHPHTVVKIREGQNVGQVAAGTTPGDTVAADTVSAVAKPKEYGVMLEAPAAMEAHHKESESDGLSWVFGGLLLLFVMVCIKFKNNYRYMKAVIVDLTDVRRRHNAFDDTVKETSFLLMLDMLWVFSAGVLIYQGLSWYTGLGDSRFGTLPHLPGEDTLGIAICCGVAFAYFLLMLLAYFVVGRVFSDSQSTSSWIKGFLASQGLTALLLFPTAMISLCYPEATEILLIISAVGFGLGKIIFIYKGFRIFFTQIASWLLFLYYLCSLEIVPLILTLIASLYLCGEIVK